MLTSAITFVCCISLRMLSTVEAIPTDTDDEAFNWQQYIQDWSNPSSPAQHLASHQHGGGSIDFTKISDAHDASGDNVLPASIHHDLDSTARASQWQESPHPLEEAQSWSRSSISAPSTPYNLVHSPQEISQADLDFLHEILFETDNRDERSEAAQQPNNVDIAASSASQDQQRHLSKSEMGTPPVRASVKGSKISDKTLASRKRKAFRKWPEPEFLKSIPYQPGFHYEGGQTGNLLFEVKKGLVGDLSSRLFAGKLHVVDDRILDYLSDVHFLKKWPVERASLPLPFVTTTAPDGTKLKIHLTLQNSSIHSKHLKGTAVQNRPFYMVFGVPEELKPKDNPIVYYGAGYLDPKDNSEVDQHFKSLLAKGEEIHL